MKTKPKFKKLAYLIMIILLLALSLEGIIHLLAKADLKTAFEEEELSYLYEFQTSQKTLELTMKKGEAYAELVRNGPLEYVTTPLIAIWIEDEDGNFIKTLYVSSKLFEIDRPTALPVWQHKSNIGSNDNQLVDGVSSASNKGNQIVIDNQFVSQNILLCVELNRSYDYNDYYKAVLNPEDIGYNADYSGQPSLIYQIQIEDLTKETELTFNLVGHGSADGSSGEILEDLKHITTAKEIMSRLSLQIK